jgi:hypothetical protein
MYEVPESMIAKLSTSFVSRFPVSSALSILTVQKFSLANLTHLISSPSLMKFRSYPPIVTIEVNDSGLMANEKILS